MKIEIICDSDRELISIMKKIKYRANKSKQYKKYKINFIENQSDVDIYIILSNDLEYIYSKSFTIKDKRNLMILTSNLRAANVVGCLNLTPYLYFTKTKIDTIIFKIIKIYEKNHKQPINFPVKKDS